MPKPNPFAGDSARYARHRPRYPGELFAWLATVAPSRTHAVDVATGNGQAAVDLARHFDQVSAFDASREQLAEAPRLPNVAYAVAAAEAIPLPDGCADLVTVAQALHWFDLDRFYPEARRVLKPGGVIAAWTYNLLTIDPAIDDRVRHLYHDILGPWWPPERQHVESGYARLPFPFTRLTAPPCAMHADDWTCDHLLGYLRTWSAYRRHLADGRPDPLAALAPELRRLFGPGRRQVRWPLTVLAGQA